MKIAWVTSASVDDQTQAFNVSRVHAIGLPQPDWSAAWREHPLAIIAAGPSVSDHVETLRNWPGERWAINGAASWCAQNGIDATFVCIDAAKWDFSVLRPFNRPGNKALVASCVDIGLINALDACRIEVFDIGPNGVPNGSCTATTCLHLAPRLGHTKSVLFGCESSFRGDLTHVNEREQISLDHAIMVRCGNENYLTRTQLAIQAEELSSAVREFPDIYSEKSGGLLRAMVKHGEYEVVAVSDGVRKTLNPTPSFDDLPALTV